MIFIRWSTTVEAVHLLRCWCGSEEQFKVRRSLDWSGLVCLTLALKGLRPAKGPTRFKSQLLLPLLSPRIACCCLGGLWWAYRAYWGAFCQGRKGRHEGHGGQHCIRRGLRKWEWCGDGWWVVSFLNKRPTTMYKVVALIWEEFYYK